MNVSVNPTSSFTQVNPDSVSAALDNGLSPASAIPVHEAAFSLGLWLSGLESFLRIRNYAFAEIDQSKSALRDWSREFRLTHSALLKCSDFALCLCEDARKREFSGAEDEIDLDKLSAPEVTFNFSFAEASALSESLKRLVLLNETLLRAAPNKLGEWISWCDVLGSHLAQSEAAVKIIKRAESEGEKNLPESLLELFRKSAIPSPVEADLQVILPHFAKILRWLKVIGEMLKNDEPLKPTLLIFSRIYEQMQEMMGYLRNRLLRFASEEEALYGILDCALYAASIELRKVFGFELVGLSEMRQPLSIRSKIETSHALLNDCIQLILVQFAQFVEPGFEPTKIFPNFETKLDQSLVLRRDLWFIQQAVREAEHNPENQLLEKLNEKLDNFINTSLRFMMFKDCETFERFAEEVARTRSKKDLVPILHRFGAYLETLFGQINMRTVLSDHPFDYPKE